MIEKFDNATIFLKNGGKKCCDVITVTSKGVFTANISSSADGRSYVIDNGFVPKDQIEQVLISSMNGTIKEISL